MADTLNTIIPWVLLIIGIVWVYSVFGEHFKRFFEWIKGLFSSNKDRFQAPVGGVKEFVYQ